MADLLHAGMHAETTPDKPAYIMAGSGTVVTYAELEARSNRCAHWFRSRGLKRGDAIALCLENHPWYLAICWGAQRAGLYFTCIATHLTGPEAAYIVNDCGARVFIGSPARADAADGVLAADTSVEHYLMIDKPRPGFESLDAALADQPETPIADQAMGTDMLYSSGTTGRPKGVRVALKEEPFGTPSPVLMRLAALYQMNADTVYLSPAPLYHAAPLRFCMAILALGGTVVVMERFDPEQALALIEQYNATHSQWVPTMFVRMLKLPASARDAYDLSSHKVAIHAAAPCPVPVKEKLIDWWGPIVWEYYAGTEGNGTTIINSAQWLAHKGSVGRAVIGQLRICDDDGEELPVGEIGTIHFSDGNDFSYHNDPEKTAASRNRHGWTTLGDVGYLDGEGYLYLTDRKAHMIISGGVNIYPQEVENLLVGHPKVLDAAVFGIPHPDLGEQVHAVVQPTGGAPSDSGLEDELLAYCRDNLSHVKCPRSLELMAELPREANGKLYKQPLKARYWPKAEGRI